MGHANEQEKKAVSRYLLDLFERTPIKTIRGMRPLDSAVVRGIFDKLSTSPPPMLVLCGRHDPVVFPRDQRTVAEITQAQFVDLPCGHMILLAQPEHSAQAFLRFAQLQDKPSEPLAQAA